MFKDKRGAVVESETVHITGLIILMAILIILYMVLIPPEAQKEILEKGKLPDKETGQESKLNTFLLETPGLVFPESKEKEVIKIPSINLFSKTSQKITDLAPSVTVTRSLVNNNFYDLNFKLDNIENINKLKLFFNVVSAKGSLVISLNDQISFRGIPSKEILPLELPTANLKSENKIKIETSSPGWKFLSVNKYEIKDLKLIKEALSENKKEIRSFTLEKDKVKKTKLNFFINCLNNREDQGILKIFLNKFNIHLAQIICDANQQALDIQEDYFEEGRNELSFEADIGNYIVEQIELEVNSERGKSPTYFFDVSESDLNNEFVLRMDLVPNEDDERSTAALLINSERITLDTDRNTFSKDISEFIKEGENFIKILPRNEFEIISLEVFSK